MAGLGAAKIFMVKISELQTDVSSRFFAVLEDVYRFSARQYECGSLSDLDYAVMGTLRCLSKVESGQEFLQVHAESGGRVLSADHFFKALKSGRRLTNVSSLNDGLREFLGEKVRDRFAGMKECEGYHFFAGDGHYQRAACFDPKPSGGKDETGEVKKERQVATGHFFRLDLRSHHLSYLDLAQPKDGKKKDHDVPAIKRVEVEELRYGAEKGERVVYFWDKACVDYGM